MRYERMTRVNELIQRELGMLFERLIAPRAVGGLVTVTRVDTSPDLRHAKVYISIFGNRIDRAGIMKVVRERRVEMQREINRNIQIKFTPVLEFILDDTMDGADRVLALLDEISPDIEETESDV